MATENQDGNRPTGEPELTAPGRSDNERQLLLEFVQTILDGIGLRGRAEVAPAPNGWAVSIHPRQSSGLLIGRQGETLRAIEHLARLVMAKRFPHVTEITVDVAGYSERRRQFLIAKARAVARIVRETGREMLVDEVTEAEAQTVRAALADDRAVRLRTVGTGPRRNIVIGPAQ